MDADSISGTVRCSVCGRWAEVSRPDGTGDQVHYCGLHEPA